MGGNAFSFRRAADGWQMEAIFITADDASGGSFKNEYTATPASGTTYAITIEATDTQAWITKKGGQVYRYAAYMVKPGPTPERELVTTAEILVYPYLADELAGLDVRSVNREILDSLERALIGRATAFDLSKTVDGITISQMNHLEIARAVGRYRWLVYLETRPKYAAGVPIRMTSTGRR